MEELLAGVCLGGQKIGVMVAKGRSGKPPGLEKAVLSSVEF